jgi:hypothetical protein
VHFANGVVPSINVLVESQLVFKAAASTACHANSQRDVLWHFLLGNDFLDFFGSVLGQLQ